MAISQLYPTQRPALDLNFARQKRLDSRVTFTRGSTATYVDSDGLIKTAASGEARFDHDSDTGESLGLLIEGSRTNKLLYSSALDSGKWTSIYGISNADVFASVAGAPDGSSAAKEVRSTATSGTAYHSYYGNGGVGTGNWNFSIFVKPNGITTIELKVDAAYALGGTIFDLTGDGSVTSGSGSFVKLSNGWWRLSTYGDISAHQRADCAVYFTSAGDGSSGFYLWGAQLEAGSFPTSYIPTTTATVTRSADVASMTGTNFSSWYNNNEGSLFFTQKTSTSPTNSTYYYLITTGGTTNGYRIAGQVIPINASGGNAWSSNASWLSLYPGSTFQNMAFAYSDGSAATAKDGAILETNTESLAAVTPTTLRIAYNVTSTVSRITYYPTRLSNDQLQALTL